MKTFNLGVLVLAIVATQAIAGVPDPCSTISPWDVYGHAFMTPGPGAGLGEVEIFVCDPFDNEPVEGADVVIDLFDCDQLCINPGEDGLTGISDANGIVRLKPQVGGCEDCLVVVRANGVTIGVYESVRSTDWDGEEADGIVGVPDFAFFATAFRVTQNVCADYNGDGAVNGTDFAMFATSFRRIDVNPGGCW